MALHSGAARFFATTTVDPSPDCFHGMVVKVMSFGRRSFMLKARSRRFSMFASCGSVVKDSVAAFRTPRRDAGLRRMSLLRTLRAMDDRKAC